MPEVLDAKAELEQLRRLKFLEDKMVTRKPSFLKKAIGGAGRAFEAVGKGLGESVQPIEGMGVAGEIANILQQPTRLVGQFASIPFTNIGQMFKGNKEHTHV